MTKEEINNLAVDTIIECGYGYGIITDIETIERESMKEHEADSDYVTLVFVDGVFNDSGCWHRTDESDVYQIEELQADEFKIIEKGESDK
ncbi:MAG: hypothetical protein J6S49_08015 [Erysipelotrichaceae bacterium]|nr:hypothetical protein [Erysipelotrichaceae bacterium]